MRTLLLILIPMIMNGQIETKIPFVPSKKCTCGVCQKEMYVLDDSGIGNKVFPYETDAPGDSLIGENVYVVSQIRLCQSCWHKYYGNSDIDQKIRDLWLDYWRECIKKETDPEFERQSKLKEIDDQIAILNEERKKYEK